MPSQVCATFGQSIPHRHCSVAANTELNLKMSSSVSRNSTFADSRMVTMCLFSRCARRNRSDRHQDGQSSSPCTLSQNPTGFESLRCLYFRPRSNVNDSSA